MANNPPKLSNPEIEEKLIAGIIKDPLSLSYVEDIITHKTFGFSPFGIIYKGIKTVANNGYIADPLTISTELEILGLLSHVSLYSDKDLKGLDALKKLSETDVDLGMLESYAYMIQELQSRRELRETFSQLVSDIDAGATSQDVITKSDKKTGQIAIYLGVESHSVKSSKDVTIGAVTELLEAKNGKEKFIHTGLAFWDDFTNGLYPGRLYLISARSNEGKSALAQNIIKLLSVDKKIHVHYFTFESGAIEVHNRLVQIMTSISPLDIEKGIIPKDKRDQFEKATERLKESPHTYDDSSEMALPLLRTKMRQAVQAGARVIIIDQLEQLSIGGGLDNQAEHLKINYISYRIKAYAKELNIPVILVHQSNRSSQSGENRNKVVDMQLTDLAQGGEKAADAVIMVRTTKEPTIWWTKNRQGRKGKRLIDWLGDSITFKDSPNQSEYPTDADYEQTLEPDD